MRSVARTPIPRAPWQKVLTRLADQTGAVAMEYGLIAALIALAILGTLLQLGGSVANLPLQSLVDAFQAAVS
jgi:Flp pilus assembly pilin Flp